MQACENSTQSSLGSFSHPETAFHFLPHRLWKVFFLCLSFPFSGFSCEGTIEFVTFGDRLYSDKVFQAHPWWQEPAFQSFSWLSIILRRR